MSTSFDNGRPAYPPAPTDGTIDVYHGVSVPDPYRPLEDINSPVVHDWIAAQNRLTADCTGRIPNRDALLARLKQLLNQEASGLPVKAGGRYFTYKTDGVRNQFFLQVGETVDGAQRVLIDPNTWSTDGTVALTGLDISLDGRWLLYAKSFCGSDWKEWHVLNVDTGEELPDVLKWSKRNAAISMDASTIYYTRWPEPAPGEEYTCRMQDLMVCRHRLGTHQGDDEVIFSLPEHPDWFVNTEINEERDLLVYSIEARGSEHTRLYFQDLTQPAAPVERTLNANDALYTFVTNYGRHVILQTTLDAPNSRVIEVDLNNPAPENWRELIPETSLALQRVTVAGGYLFVHYLKDVHWVTHRYRPDGTFVDEVRFPGHGMVMGFAGRKEDPEVFYAYQDLSTPMTTYRYDSGSGAEEFIRANKVPVDTSRFEARLQFYRAPDGTAVPLFLLHRRGIERDGSHPTILYGYGGFGIPQLPYFDVTRMAWVELGGVYAVACIRGGGEYGRAWHEAAVKTKRQVAFDDFTAGAEYLIDQGYTSCHRLAIQGGSNGGTLVGVVMTQHPELFAAALISAGSLDELRSNQWGLGSCWEFESGSPNIEEEFHVLHSYSPYHNLHPGVRYPATLVMTGDTDDRVLPAHSYKYAARLQDCQAEDGPPTLLRVETGTGHGLGKPRDKYLAELADMYAFALHNMGLEIPADIGDR